MREATLQVVRDLAPDLRGRRLSSPSVTYDGEAIFLAMPPGPPAVQTKYFGLVHPEEEHGHEYSCELLICSADALTEVPLRNVRLWLPRLQRLPKDQLLLVDVGGWWPDATNAHVYSMDGGFIRSFHLSGTEDIFTDPNGSIWASFDDESASGKEGSSALVRLDGQGVTQWGFNENRGEAENVWIFYALNVGRRFVWACGYTEFEVIRIEGNLVMRWKQTIGGISELAVGEHNILMLGAHHEGDPRFWLGRLGESEIENIEEIQVTLPDGRFLRELDHPLEKYGIPPAQRRRECGFRILGRDDALHVFAEDHWFRLTVEDASR